ncbi:hypothetical protein K523DRAFT_275011 [Schizophyllum commune Tattone D]|uniref:Expressed protein n=1 Tax=Schizophyllum commune (strain H4-8 / FGSC 9210) TaxID=578458 RepID=D8Q035_SCHCM|nr:uncharacterized protein SCHCODRAFT_02615398 [Schizophyllum commune H4-8]KAI4525265.1 hypothetical protein K525DRAFT_266220 [Schizophyllum commune Loenen D]KAI5829231.1 hypothetical protein K523DRAFT_275011 [Schizophyllum commune Tattone D]KAI5896629.1 hypothetical protein SCHCODRAFT_02615398 [Schizophyllum commune H4-8]
MAASSNDILSWTNKDPRESQLYNSFGVAYRFQTNVSANSNSVTVLWRTIRANKEDRVAKLEWSATGGLGRIIIGKNTLPMADLVRPDARVPRARIFNGPDGNLYRWRPASNGMDIVLQDMNQNVIAFWHPLNPPSLYQAGEVHGELHFIRTAGAGTVTHPPMMDHVIVTAMLYRFCEMWGI